MTTDQRTLDDLRTAEVDLARVDAYWRAANYLSVGQIYLMDNPLLTEPLRPEHVKPRLLGHWGTTPGLNLIYAHLNRVIVERDVDAMYVTGPGHGGLGIVANAYLEGTYSEVYPEISRDVDGLRRLFRQFSFPGGIPSHVAPETPGSIHEGGELGYALVHAYGAAFDNPDLTVACVIGDGEAETGPLAASWHSNKFVDPVRDGVVLPILHLNGYKIANPTVLARIPEPELIALMQGYGHRPIIVSGDDPVLVHRALAAAMDDAFDDIAAIRARARASTQVGRPVWPMIVLRTPKGWTGPAFVDGVPVEGTWRAHQVPLSEVRTDAGHRAQLEEWMRSYEPEKLFTAEGALRADLAALAPTGVRRMSANPHANGGILLQDLLLPDFRDYAVDVPRPAAGSSSATFVAGSTCAAATLALDVYVHRLAGSATAMTAALGGLDVLVFTGGVGERAAEIRRRTATRLAHLGVRIDERRNAVAEPDTDISAGDGVRILVIASREDLQIAAEVEHTLVRLHDPVVGVRPGPP